MKDYDLSLDDFLTLEPIPSARPATDGGQAAGPLSGMQNENHPTFGQLTDAMENLLPDVDYQKWFDEFTFLPESDPTSKADDVGQNMAPFSQPLESNLKSTQNETNSPVNWMGKTRSAQSSSPLDGSPLCGLTDTRFDMATQKFRDPPFAQTTPYVDQLYGPYPPQQQQPSAAANQLVNPFYNQCPTPQQQQQHFQQQPRQQQHFHQQPPQQEHYFIQLPIQYFVQSTLPAYSLPSCNDQLLLVNPVPFTATNGFASPIDYNVGGQCAEWIACCPATVFTYDLLVTWQQL